MIPCIVGIGGCGGKVLKLFLVDRDVAVLGRSLGEHIAFGGIKGIWMDSATMDAQKDTFYGRLEDGVYPGYLIPPEVVKDNSEMRKYIQDKYGYDVKRAGFDRRAEYLKAVFEIFSIDGALKEIAKREYGGEENPVLAYIWRRGIHNFTMMAQASDDARGNSELHSHGAVTDEPDTPGSVEKTPGGDAAGETDDAATSEAAKETPKKDESGADGVRRDGSSSILGRLSSMITLNSLKRPGEADSDPSNPWQGMNVCDSILFIASLGGGTGTGFINPITSYVRSQQKGFTVFAMCILTEKGEDDRHTSEEQRDLGAVIAMYDLLTKRKGLGIDALILMDNQVLLEKFDKNYPAINKGVFEALRPFIERRNFPDARTQSDALAIARVFLQDLEMPGMLVPCYNSADMASQTESELVKNALTRGRLFPCEPKKAEIAYVFTRGFLDLAKIRKAVHDTTGLPEDEQHIMIYRKVGDKSQDEVLIFLRNPYGGDGTAYSREGTLENRIYGIISMALKYMRENEANIITGLPDDTRIALGTYLYGGEIWLNRELEKLEGRELNMQQLAYKKKLESARSDFDLLEIKPPFLEKELKKSLARLEKGDKPIFIEELSIFRKDAMASKDGANEISINRNGNGFMDDEELRAKIRAELMKILEEEEALLKT